MAGRLPGATLPASQLLVEFHMPRDIGTIFDVIDLLLADNFRVFSAEPNYYCGNGCCASIMTELAFEKVTPDGHVCIPHGYSTAGDNSLVQLPTGCLSPSGIITN
jgi:hypothetical protein